MNKLNHLRFGDTIQVVAPGSPFDKKDFMAGVGILESFGFKVKYNKAVFTRKGFLAGSDAVRARELIGAIKNPKVRAIYCARGGYGALRLLPLLKKIRSCDKPVLGFSDVTILHTLWNQKFKTPSIHAPLITSLSRANKVVKSAVSALLYGLPFQDLDLKRVKTYCRGQGEGQLVGGNLSTLCSMAGTGYLKPWPKAVLLLEDVGERAYGLDRMLQQLDLAGYFKGVKAVLLGDFSAPASSKDLKKLVPDTLKDFFRQRKIPTIGGLPVGHIKNNFPLPFGLKVRVDASRCRIQFRENWCN